MPDVMGMRMPANVAFGLKYGDLMLFVQMVGNGIACDSATDNGDFQSEFLSVN